MMNATQDISLSHGVPPYSPVVYSPPVKYSYPFETDYSRDPVRVREVFDDLVERTKEMNLGKPEIPSGRHRARNLGLKVNIGQAKGLHWRSIQARHPVVLTESPTSPPRTPRRPATDYPSAEQLCLKNMADAQKKQDFAEACRWSVFAEREHAIRKWEAEQAAMHIRQASFRIPASELSDLSPSTRSQKSYTDYVEAGWDMPFSGPNAGPSNAQRTEQYTRSYHASPTTYRHNDGPQYQTVVEMPTLLMDRSQNLNSESSSGGYYLGNNIQSFDIPRGSNSSLQNVRLSRSSSMQRHIPETSLRMAPTPIRPRIDQHSQSYPSPQETRLSYVQPMDPTAQPLLQNFSGLFGYPVSSNIGGVPLSQSTVPSMGLATPDQAGADDSFIKKRRSVAEHFASPKRKLL